MRPGNIGNIKPSLRPCTHGEEQKIPILHHYPTLELGQATVTTYIVQKALTP